MKSFGTIPQNTPTVPADSFRLGETVGYEGFTTGNFRVVGIRTEETTNEIAQLELHGDWSQDGRCYDRDWVEATKAIKK